MTKEIPVVVKTIFIWDIVRFHVLTITLLSTKVIILLGLGYCLTPYQRPRLYNGAPLVAFCDTLGIRRTYSRLKPPASSRGYYIVCNRVFFSTFGMRPGFAFVKIERIWYSLGNIEKKSVMYTIFTAAK